MLSDTDPSLRKTAEYLGVDARKNAKRFVDYIFIKDDYRSISSPMRSSHPVIRLDWLNNHHLHTQDHGKNGCRRITLVL